MLVVETLVHLAFLGLALAGVKLGIWTAAHPDRFLNVFNPYLKPYSRWVLSFTRGWGLVCVFVFTCGSVGIAASIIVPGRFPTVRLLLTVAGFVIASVVTVRAARQKPVVMVNEDVNAEDT